MASVVVGTDPDEEKLALAREEAKDWGLTNTEFRNADAMAFASSEGAFDFVFARQLLCHVPEPALVLTQMIAYASPGGLKCRVSDGNFYILRHDVVHERWELTMFLRGSGRDDVGSADEE